MLKVFDIFVTKYAMHEIFLIFLLSRWVLFHIVQPKCLLSGGAYLRAVAHVAKLPQLQPITPEKNENLFVHCVFCKKYIKDLKELEDH